LIDCKFLNIFVTIFALIGWRLQGEIRKKLFTAVLHLHNTQPLLCEDRRLFDPPESSPRLQLSRIFLQVVWGGVWAMWAGTKLTEEKWLLPLPAH